MWGRAMIGSCRVRNDYRAARDYAWPSKAAFAMALSDGGIACPLQTVADTSGIVAGPGDDGGFVKLECLHFVMVPPAKTNTARLLVRRKRPCPTCAHQLYEQGDPEIGRQFARWAASRLQMLRSEDCEPARAEALDATQRRFSLAAVRRFNAVSDLPQASNSPRPASPEPSLQAQGAPAPGLLGPKPSGGPKFASKPSF